MKLQRRFFRKRKKIKQPKKPKTFLAIIPVILLFFLGTITIGFISIIGIILYFYQGLPEISSDNFVINQSSTIYDRNEQKLYTIHGGENRDYISIAEIPESMQNAIVAYEDDTFWEHSGYDTGGIAKAICYEAWSNQYKTCRKNF